VGALLPFNVVTTAGVTTLNGLSDPVVIPRTVTATSAAFLASETPAAVTETPPTLGAASLTPKTAMALVKFSMQLLKQGAAAEMFIRAMLLRAVGELLDKVFFAGAGGSEPLGLLKTPGVGTQSGTGLALAGLLAMQETILLAGGREDSLRTISHPTTQKLLAARQTATGTSGFLWDAAGVLGKPAHATRNAPASTLVMGDFSQAIVGIFGPGIRIDIDPSQDFNSGGLVARVLLMCDVAFPRPDAFCVATSVT